MKKILEKIIEKVIEETINSCTSEDIYYGIEYNGNKEETIKKAIEEFEKKTDCNQQCQKYIKII